MKRDLEALSGEEFDVLVVGAGIHGAFAAWDAAMRGLRVALIDRGDLGGATSSNSLKIAHGGFRHLQHADLGAVRESLDEQLALRRIAPHLVRELPCVMEVTTLGARNPVAVRAALGVYHRLARSRARAVAGTPVPERGRLVGREEITSWVGVAPLGLPWTRGALWFDAIIDSPERLLVGVVRAAAVAGATVASYVEATKLAPRRGDRGGGRGGGGGMIVTAEDTECTAGASGAVPGAGAGGGGEMRDVLGRGQGGSGGESRGGRGDRFEIRARVVLDAAGPWGSELLARCVGRAQPPREEPLALACNIVTRLPAPRAAIAIRHPAERRMLFAVPWHGRLMLGTSYELARGAGDPDAGVDLERLVRFFGEALPALPLSVDDVTLVHRGLLPARPAHVRAGRSAFAERSPNAAHHGSLAERGSELAGGSGVALRSRAMVIDHGARGGGGVDGLVSMIGVKWTTARRVAARAVDLCEQRLREPVRGGGEGGGGAAGRWRSGGGLARGEVRDRVGEGGEGEGAVRGTHRTPIASASRIAEEIDAIARECPPLAAPLISASATVGAQVVHAIRHEMALHLDDIVLRRTEMGVAGPPPSAELAAAACIAARELGWSSMRAADELARVRAVYRRGMRSAT